MLNARARFQSNIQQANELGVLYDTLVSTLTISGPFDDLLRSQIVNAVSAFDKLMHDLILVGMVMIFENRRPSTGKYMNESIAISNLPMLLPNALQPPAVFFESMIRKKLGYISFQKPSNISDGLSYIWTEDQKWRQIANGLGMSETDVKQRQELIVTRRNAIVHEADLDPVSHQKQSITSQEAADTSNFLLNLGNRICDLVI